MLRLTGTAGAAIGLGGLAGCIGGDDGDDEDENDGEDDDQFPDGPEDVAPIVFVHGSSGSATQFASNAMRFESNGVPRERLYAYEYDTSAELSENEEEVLTGLDETLDAVLEEHDVDGATVLGHSRGTRVMHSYLSTEERAAKVANYVNLDGEVSDSPPGSVRTLAVWADYGIGAEGPVEIGDAENVSFEQAHVEVATSEETFGAVYEFLLGEEPETTSIEAEPADEVTLAGRATYFPVNDGVAGGSLDVYEVDPDTGERVAEEPHASESLDDDGSWGPIDVDGEAVYEFALQRPEAGTHHFYRTPALHSNHFVRLNTSRPGEGVDQLIERGPDHASIVVNRDKEFWGDQGKGNDELTIDGTNVVNEATAAREDWIVAPIVFDAGSDGESTPGQPIPIFEQVSFLTGVDLHVPAADPPDGTIPIAGTPRDGDGLQRDLAVPNWASDEHRITVSLPDHTQSR